MNTAATATARLLCATIVGLGCAGLACSSTAPEVEGADTATEAVVGVCATTQSVAITRHKQASGLLRYILGGSATGTWRTSCPTLATEADKWRSDVLTNKFGSTSFCGGGGGVFPLAPTTICGLQALPVQFLGRCHASPAPSGSDKGLVAAAKACFGSDIEPFVSVISPQLACAACGDWQFQIDPEPAITDASLGSTAASAAAHGKDSLEPLTAYRFASSTLSATGRAAWVGMPCVNGTTAVPQGTLVKAYVAYANSPTNTYLKCVSFP